MTIPKALLEATFGNNPSWQTIRDLRDYADSVHDVEPVIRVFLKHLSFPLQPHSDFEDRAAEHPLHALAVIALSPTLNVIEDWDSRAIDLPTPIVRAAPDIWKWISCWTRTAFLVKGELATAFRISLLEHVLQAVNKLIRHKDLIVPEAVDVVVAHFCLAGRSERVQASMQSIRHRCGGASSSDPEQDLVVGHLEMVVRSSLYDPVSSQRLAPNAVRAAWLQRIEEIVDHACMHIDLRHPGLQGELHLASLENACSLVFIIRESVHTDPVQISVLPEDLLRRALASVLRVYHYTILHAATALHTQTGTKVPRICALCCQVLLAVIDGQQSLLRASTLLRWALRNGMLQTLVRTPRQGAGDTLKMYQETGSGRRKVDMMHYVLDFVVLRRMWSFSVYQAVSENIKDAPHPPIGKLLERWAHAHSVVSEEVAFSKSTCHYSFCPNEQLDVRKRRCAGCAHTYFCSDSCQRAAWRDDNHRYHCKLFMARRSARLLPITGTESNFMSFVLGIDLNLQEEELKRELRRCILGAGSQLEARFNYTVDFSIGYASPMNSPADEQLESLWGDMFRQQTQDHLNLVIIRVCGGHPYEDVLHDLQSAAIYSVVRRPSWLPLAL